MSIYVDIKKTFPGFELSVKFEGETEILSLLGASGCGKSLTLKCIAGIEKPDWGKIIINGETVFDSDLKINLSPQKRKAGYMFQNYALFPNMTVFENIKCVINQGDREKIARDIIESFYLNDVASQFPNQLSGGQQQRTALARMLVTNPEIIMLDEPFSALDSHLKWNLEQEMLSILSKFKGTTIFVSHDYDEVYRFCDKIILINGGKIETIGNKEETFRYPKTAASATIMGWRNLCPAKKIDDYHVKAVDWGVTIKTPYNPKNDFSHVCINPYGFKRVFGANSDENSFKCDISKIIDEPFGKTILFSFEGCKNKGYESKNLLQYKISHGEYPGGGFEGENSLFLKIPEESVVLVK